MPSMGAAVCGYCGAPLRELVDGACPYCKTPVLLPDPAAAVPTTVPAGVPAGIAVRLSDAGRKKINVIKVVREATGLGLKESKDLVEAATPQRPVVVLAGLSDPQSTALLEELRKAGATADRVQF